MLFLFLKTRKLTRVINLASVSAIDLEPESIDFWLNNGASESLNLISVRLKPGTDTVKLLSKAFIPMYEGRMNNVIGLRIDLDLTEYEPEPVPDAF